MRICACWCVYATQIRVAEKKYITKRLVKFYYSEDFKNNNNKNRFE